ncbi:ATP-binding protein [Trinickia caryophylli]|uniref:histidine kinase n=1 Tax=Trinickia caryophylli TaxID=28094 RepID=A0A1X7D721_TRICW|nr:ATP-binding protein [Trinickia caryophylli]PMS12658.1 HAMP domain-containing protein [Trinickia caryophylli]TRX15064.1 HAMP domain-containing protein [Trinickia caryophylli]WQE14922.1 ATP-binding protein [Trinickia caryophylli]SMF10075.1 two-component system, OmpR family, sensor histidine kinase BaeS [Trinickia caryophylli]GLU31350.1 two-component sensor histidine kinase [Trinickia caryophylli]
MRIGITSKLFLAVLAVCILIAVAMGVAMRFSFQRGFVDYLTAQNSERTKQLSLKLEQAYAMHGNWDFLRQNSQAWLALTRSVLPASAPGGARAPDTAGRPAFPGGSPEGGPPPDEAGAPPGGPPPGLPPDAGDGPGSGRMPPMTLYDAQMRRVAANGPPPPPGERRLPLKVAGTVVGWLTVASPANMLYAADRQFQARQIRATWIIVGFAVLLSAAVAIVLARLFLAPARRLVLATHRLASGDYATRVPESGSDELSQLASDFNRLATSLEAAERSRRDFIADISHELRTPLAVLRGELEAIEDGVRRLDAATLTSLQSEVTMLSQLIDDLYELSLADIGALSFEKVRVNVAPLVEGAAEAVRERLAAKQIALETDFGEEPALMSADPHRLTQLMKNLLENSLRYTDPGGKVRVSVATTRDELRIDVQDSYPSVPEPLLPHLFDRLFRADPSRSRQSGGAGLGLALCRHIVREHCGTITASRSALGGLWIAARFPISPTRHD